MSESTRRIGVHVTLDRPMGEYRRAIEELVDLGYTDLWSSEVNGADAFTTLALAAAWAPAARIGTALVSSFTRGPGLLAQSAAALAVAAPGRFVLGIGASSPVVVEQWNAGTYEKPVQRTRDMVRFLRASFTGTAMSEAYETFRVEGHLLGVVPEPAPRILVGALRPMMLRLAGREADGAIVNMQSASNVKLTAPFVREGGPHKEVVAGILVCPSTDTDRVRAEARRYLAGYVTVPGYRAFQEWLGRSEELALTWQRWAAGDRRAAAAAIPDSTVDDLIVHGDPESCKEQIQRYVDNGVDTPVLWMMPWGVDWVTAARALAPAAA